MVDRDTFERYVQGALDHLYDPAALLVHPLAALLAADAREPLGHALHRTLREALDQLKPPPDAPHHSPAWRSYRYLVLRYVEMLTVEQVADELGISTRQCRRDHHEAIRAVATILWDRYRRRRANESTPPSGAQRAGLAGELLRTLPDAPRDEMAADRPHSNLLPRAEGRSDEVDEPEGALLVREAGRIGAAGEEPTTSLDRVVAGVVATVGALAAQKHCTLVVGAPFAVPEVRADRTVLRQILVQLLLLAVDHGAEGAVRLDARFDGSSVELTTEARAGRAEGAPGTIGGGESRLAVARRLAELQGMTLRVDAVADPVLLTLVVPAVRVPRILVVDDNADVIHLFRHYLEGRYEVIEASGAAPALDAARQAQPALITLDVMMPRQDGWEVLQVLKQDPATARIPVVVCSVLRERELALSLGAAEFLPKPVLGPALLQSVERCLAAP